MPRLTLVPQGRGVEVLPDESALEALRRAGVGIESPCDGAGTCGKCRVRVVAGEAPETPHPDLGAAEAAAGVRLACRLRPTTDLTLELGRDRSLDGRVLEGEALSAVRVAPAARVRTEAAGAWLDYRGLPSARLEEWPADFSPKGLAVDLGTTTLVVTLLDLVTGREVATASAVNPQVRFGHDVLTRIQRASAPEGLRELADTVREELNRLIAETCAAAASDPAEIVDAVIGANPTMLELAAGIDPSGLGRLPFRVTIGSGASHPASRFGLKLNPTGRVYVPPVAHAFVGADISAGLLASGFFERRDPTLFLDIGTNGELGLNAGGRWLVTSAAAGPAFEGMGISRGMRAAEGAVEAVSWDGADLRVDTVGGGAAQGVCGSGILDLVACLVRLGAVDRSGRMLRPGEGGALPPAVAARLREADGKPAFAVADGVVFTQADVRQVQLAKGALRTAVDLLLAEADISAGALREVVLAGAFGYHLRPESLDTIGLLPPGLAERVTFAGNTSRTGAALLLLEADHREALEARMRRVVHLALPESRAFQDRFVANLSFPPPQ